MPVSILQWEVKTTSWEAFILLRCIASAQTGFTRHSELLAFFIFSYLALWWCQATLKEGILMNTPKLLPSHLVLGLSFTNSTSLLISGAQWDTESAFLSQLQFLPSSQTHRTPCRIHALGVEYISQWVIVPVYVLVSWWWNFSWNNRSVCGLGWTRIEGFPEHREEALKFIHN